MIYVSDRRERAMTPRAALATSVLGLHRRHSRRPVPLKSGLDLRNIDKTIVLYPRRS